MEAIKTEGKTIRLVCGARYEIQGNVVYSLNYAERGMCGSSLGKILPEKLAKEILTTYNRQEAYRQSRAEKAEKRKARVKKKEESAKVKPKKVEKAKPKKTAAAKKRLEKASGTGVKLGGFLKKT